MPREKDTYNTHTVRICRYATPLARTTDDRGNQADTASFPVPFPPTRGVVVFTLVPQACGGRRTPEATSPASLARVRALTAAGIFPDANPLLRFSLRSLLFFLSGPERTV